MEHEQGRVVERLAVLCISVGVLLAGAPPLVADEFTVRLLPCGQIPDAEIEVAVQDFSPRSATSQPEVQTLRLEPPVRSFTLEVETPSRSRLFLASMAFWAEPGTKVGSLRTEPRLSVWPRSSVTGRVRVPRGEPLPEELTVRLHRSKTRPHEISPHDPCFLDMATVDCGLDGEGRFDCAVPSGRWNLRIKAEGWAARHLWDIDLAPQRREGLGALSLRRGATLIGEVTTIDGPVEPAMARVRVFPVSDDVELSRQHRSSTSVNYQGFFVFKDLRPGRYQIVAHHHGYAENRRFQVQVEENRETWLREPIVLGLPVSVRVDLQPPHDLQGEDWEVRLYRETSVSDQLESVASGVTQKGHWVATSLAPGVFHLSIVDAKGSVMAGEGPLHLGNGEDLYLPIALDIVEVEGIVELGDEPLPGARLWFGGESGEPSIQVTTDEEGRFRSHLPSAGSWLADIRCDDPHVHHVSYEIDVPDEGGEVEIRLPGTRISGRVLTEEGNSVGAGVWVKVTRTDERSGSVSRQTRDDGRFEFNGLEPGQYWIQARAEKSRSEVVSVQIQQDVESPELTLPLMGRMLIEGRLESDHGGVYGARVRAFPLSASRKPLHLSAVRATSDQTGRFELEVPVGTVILSLWVYPPGFALTRVDVPLEGPGSGFTIMPEPIGGTLLLERGGKQNASAGELPLVLVDGLPIGLPDLMMWASMNNAATPEAEPLLIPAMPAGLYRYCRVMMEMLPAVFAGQAMPRDCTEGVLNTGGELELLAP